jgi:hypothetical protein
MRFDRDLTRIIFAFLLAIASMAQTKTPDILTQAREMYNGEHYDDAVRLAGEARAIPAFSTAAAVVLARAHLERYRLTSNAADLTDAREALKAVDITKLVGRDQVEFLIGLGESLYLDDQYQFDDRYSAAAEQFELALARADELDAASRDLVFDWWALALDRQAQQGLESERRPLYTRIITRAEGELARRDSSASAAYWLAAAARGVDDLPRAFGAAVAGWVRAGAMGTRGDALRVDLDRLIVQVILPERARQLTAGADARQALEVLEGQWEQLKEKWGR